LLDSLRKLFVLFLLAAIVGMGLPSTPLAGGQDDPGYTGIPGVDPGADSSGNGDDPSTDPDRFPGSSGPPQQRSKVGDQYGSEAMSASPVPSWLTDLLGILIRVR
jgi:hypothetical protein